MSTAMTPLTYLDRAMGALRNLGLLPECTRTDEAPMAESLAWRSWARPRQR